ncbi:MAG: sulfurtransferase [Fluviicola sp.]|nr:MAG: sulfurtransferase [Fluviicola sp.]
MITPLVTSEWLNENMNLEDLVILDASPLKNVSDKQAEFKNQVITGARYFDLKNVFSDPDGPFPNTFPSTEQFERGCRALGINNSSKIIVYDNLGIYTSPRVWWMFKTMGHEDVSVLNGGLPDWIKKDFETQTSHRPIQEMGNFSCRLDSNRIVDIDFIQSNISLQDHLLIDARSEKRFNGTSNEPRPGLRSGHISNSVNIPFERVLEDGKYTSKTELRQLFTNIEVDERPLSFSCGSGITACIVLLAAELVLKNDTSIYDGSWTEWASLK